jgi:hypothetical protein
LTPVGVLFSSKDAREMMGLQDRQDRKVRKENEDREVRQVLAA